MFGWRTSAPLLGFPPGREREMKGKNIAGTIKKTLLEHELTKDPHSG